MVKYDEAMRILNHEAHYEEKIVKDLANFLIPKLKEIKDLSAKEQKKAKVVLDVILSDSVRHERMFRDLIEMIQRESPEEMLMENIGNKRALIEYLKDILAMERIARDDYKKDAALFKSERIVPVIQKIKEEEDKHIMLIEGLIESLSM